jgi:hypothetical protein
MFSKIKDTIRWRIAILGAVFAGTAPVYLLFTAVTEVFGRH